MAFLVFLYRYLESEWDVVYNLYGYLYHDGIMISYFAG